MSSYETSGQETAAIDRHVVGHLLTELEACSAGEDTERWAEAVQTAGQFVDGLFNEFVPDLGVDRQTFGRMIGGTALAFMDWRYGSNEMQPRIYSGTVEQNVIATYHNGGHARRVMRDMFRYAVRCNEQEPGTYGNDNFKRFPGIAGHHDAILGNGRGNDERQSALLAVELMLRLGLASHRDEATGIPIEATTWDVVKQTQAVDPARGHVESQRAAAVGDLMPLFDRRGPYLSVCLAPEDLSLKRYDQIFIREADEVGFALVGASVDDCLGLIDQRPRLREAYGNFLKGQSGFYKLFTPADPQLDQSFPGRAQNVEFMQTLSRLYASGSLSALGTIAVCRTYLHSS